MGRLFVWISIYYHKQMPSFANGKIPTTFTFTPPDPLRPRALIEYYGLIIYLALVTKLWKPFVHKELGCPLFKARMANHQYKAQ
jgi:hypothetical protein